MIVFAVPGNSMRTGREKRIFEYPNALTQRIEYGQLGDTGIPQRKLNGGFRIKRIGEIPGE